METINKALDSASHAIWGETHPQHQQQQQQQHGDEPLSGVQGQGKVTDPYDAGNRDVQPDAPSTQSSTAPVPQKSVLDPSGRNSEPVSSAVSEDVDPQLGAYPRPGTGGNGFASTGLASDVPEEPGLEADPVLNGDDLLGKSQNQGMANTTGVPEGEQRTVLGNNPPGLNQRTSAATPTTAMAGGAGAAGAGGAGLGIGGGAAAAGSTAGRGESQAAEQRASSGGGGGEKVQYGKPSTPAGEGGQPASEEALKGPQAPPPREKYEFEKEMEGKSASKGQSQAQPQGQSQAQGGKAQNGGHHHGKAMDKMKEKLGRAKVGTHK